MKIEREKDNKMRLASMVAKKHHLKMQKMNQTDREEDSDG